MSSTQPVRVTAQRGWVSVSALYGVGTKSERDAVFFETDDRRYLLRRKTGPAYGDNNLIRYP